MPRIETERMVDLRDLDDKLQQIGFLDGKCPYVDKPCPEKIPCNRCMASDEDRKLIQMLEKQERVLDLYDDWQGE